MYPQITIGNSTIPTYGLCVGVGLLALFFYIIIYLHRRHCLDKEAYYILPKLVLALLAGLGGAILFDAIVKIPQNHGFKIEGMTFYGGLIAGFAMMTVLLLCFKKTSFTPMQWLGILTVPFVLFHFFGRIGCFLGGCCYGRATDGPFGVVFPDQPDKGIIHNGQAVYPTQLFEAAGLFVIAAVTFFARKHKFYIYAYSYPIFRFCIEFLRDDNRGSFIGALSPSQFVSVLLLAVVTIYIVAMTIVRRRKTKKA